MSLSGSEKVGSKLDPPPLYGGTPGGNKSALNKLDWILPTNSSRFLKPVAAAPNMRLRFLLSPFFLSRTLLRRAIRQAVDLAKPKGSLIDIGCGQKPHRDLFPEIQTYQGIDFKAYSANKDFQSGGPDFAFPDNYTTSWRLPFEDGSYDHSVAFEVAEHHPQPAILLSEMARVTRPGGFVLLSWPFIFPLHEEPHDHFRYTHHQMSQLADRAGLTPVRFLKTGGVFPCIVTLLTHHIAVFHDRGGWRKWVGLVLYPPFLALQYLALPFSKIASETTVLTYVAILQKPRTGTQ